MTEEASHNCQLSLVCIPWNISYVDNSRYLEYRYPLCKLRPTYFLIFGCLLVACVDNKYTDQLLAILVYVVHCNKTLLKIFAIIQCLYIYYDCCSTSSRTRWRPCWRSWRCSCCWGWSAPRSWPRPRSCGRTRTPDTTPWPAGNVAVGFCPSKQQQELSHNWELLAVSSICRFTFEIFSFSISNRTGKVTFNTHWKSLIKLNCSFCFIQLSVACSHPLQCGAASWEPSWAGTVLISPDKSACSFTATPDTDTVDTL